MMAGWLMRFRLKLIVGCCGLSTYPAKDPNALAVTRLFRRAVRVRYGSKRRNTLPPDVFRCPILDTPSNCSRSYSVMAEAGSAWF
jgi:hypothetical protein